MNRLSRVGDALIGGFWGSFIGHGIYIYWDFRAHPGLYMAESAPWYTSILIHGLFTAGFTLLFLFIKYVAQKRQKKDD